MMGFCFGNHVRWRWRRRRISRQMDSYYSVVVGSHRIACARLRHRTLAVVSYTKQIRQNSESIVFSPTLLPASIATADRSGVSLYNVVYYYRHFALLIALTLGNANLINLHAYAYLSVCLSLGARGVFMASVYRRLKVFRKKWESEWEKHCHRNPSIVSWHWLVASIPSSQWMHEWAN